MSLWSLLKNENCFYCGSAHPGYPGICSSCGAALLKRISKKGVLCPVCSQPSLASGQASCPFCVHLPEKVESILSISYFNGYMKEMVTLYKSGRNREFRFFLSDLINRILDERGWGDALIVPVPPRRLKIHSTGWDQVDLLCRTLKGRHGKKICFCLERSDRLQQKSLNNRDRKSHMENTLHLKKRYIPTLAKASVVLLDDVCTSGATLGAAAEILFQQTGSPVPAVVLSSVI